VASSTNHSIKLRTSERGSAVAEFIFLVLPLVGLTGTVTSVTWYAFAKAQLAEISAEAALQLAEADSSVAEVKAEVAEKMLNRLNSVDFSFAGEVAGGVANVNLELSAWELLTPLSMVFPELSEVSSAPLETSL
jgi:Flp pilus assembly protein TadG